MEVGEPLLEIAAVIVSQDVIKLRDVSTSGLHGVLFEGFLLRNQRHKGRHTRKVLPSIWLWGEKSLRIELNDCHSSLRTV